METVSITEKWAGFYGTISGNINLADSSGNLFYQWTVSDVSGTKIYAANGTISDWSGLAAASASDMPLYLQPSTTDNYNNTFANNESGTFNEQEINADYVQSYNSSETGVWKTYALKKGATLIWAGLAQNSGNSFKDGVVDYQLLIPAEGLTTYNFYLELS